MGKAKGRRMTDILDDDQTSQSKTAGDDTDITANHEKLLVDIWKQAVDTQKHFNDMCVKSRQLGLTFVAASLGAALYLFIRAPGGSGDAGTTAASSATYAYSFTVCGHVIILHVSLAIILAAAAAVFCVKKLDLGVYHQMLRGAVSFGEDLEARHIRAMVGLNKGMTQAISHFSRNSDASVQLGTDGRYIYSGNNKKHAGEKLTGFYSVILWFLAALGIAIFVASNFMSAV